MAFVLDASAALALVLPDELPSEPMVERLRAGERVVVPGLFPYEVLNSLLVAHRRDRIDERVVQRAIAFIEQLEASIETPRSWSGVHDMAQRWSLSAYDAAYLALARSRGLPLATNDAALGKAAERSGIALV
jgi:predicted nucleic acid-binding protein